jgi:hypothetical protein
MHLRLKASCRAISSVLFAAVISQILNAALVQTPVKASAPGSSESASLVSANSYAFELMDGTLSGPGYDFLLERTQNSQFVMVGEGHHDWETPRFVDALFHNLRASYGFEHLAVEIDPLAVETLQSAGYRGNLQRIAGFVSRYPSHIGFSSDQDLHLYARVSAVGADEKPALWGIEQAQGAAHYLEQLAALAPNETVRAEVDRLLALARKATREKPIVFLHDEPRTVGWLTDLKTAFSAPKGSRAEHLLDQLLKSAVIYSYNRRASDEPVGLFNNTEREALFKENFLRHYRRAIQSGSARVGPSPSGCRSRSAAAWRGTRRRSRRRSGRAGSVAGTRSPLSSRRSRHSRSARARG